MAVPNQNNINDIIRSRVKDINSTISIIIDAASSKIIKRAANDIESLKTYKAIIDATLGNDGVFTTIMSTIQNVENFSHVSAFKIMVIKKNLKSIEKLTDYVSNLKIDYEKAALLTNNLKPVLEMYTTIANVLNEVDALKIPIGVGIKLMFVKIALWKIAKMGFFLNSLNLMIPIMTTGMLSLTVLKTYASMLSDVFDSIENINAGPALWIKLKLIPIMLRKMLKTISVLNEIAMLIAATGGLKDSLILAKVFDIIESVFKTVKAIKIGIFFNYKLMRINKALNKIKLIIWTINKIRVKPKHILKIMLLKSLFVNVGILFATIALITPIVLLLTPVLAILILGILALKITTALIVKMLGNMVTFSVIKGLLFITLVLFFYLSFTSMLLAIALMSKPIVKSVLSILGLFGVIILVTAATIGIGMLMSLLTPIMLPTIFGLTMMIVVIGILALIAAALKIIESIRLDKKLIQERIRTIFDTVKMIINTIFAPDETESNESDKSWIASIIDFVGGTLSTIIKAIMAVAFLAVMVVAVMLILLIAGQLKLLEMIDLNDTIILENVNIVIETATSVVDSIFNRNDDTKDNPSNKGFFGKLLSYVGSGLANIIEVITAVAFLAVSLIAITLILFIATELTALQKIELKSTDIYNNVDTVIGTAQRVVDNIFNRKDTTPKGEVDEEKKGFLSKIFSGIGDGVKLIASIGWLSTAFVSVGMVSQLAKHLETINNLPKLDKVSEKAIAICNDANRVINSISGVDTSNDITSKLKMIEKISDAVEDFVDVKPNKAENSTKLVDNYIRFVDKINSIEVSKLETAANMFKQMSNFSSSIKGDFNKLAEALSEKLLPVLEELKDTMEVIPEKIDQSSQNISKSVTLSTAPSTKENMAIQTKLGNPGLTEKEVDKIVANKMNEKAKSDANGVSAKLDELITLLKGYGGEQAVVRTI